MAGPTHNPLPHVLVTAGPTEEPIDAVRFIGNRSSGKLGCAIANAFAELGSETTLLLGPVGIAPVIDPRVRTKRFRTAQELSDLMRFEWPAHELLIMAAAVADFRPVAQREGKLKRSDGAMQLELQPVPDLVAGLSDITRSDQRRIAFALESREEMLDAASRKLRAKGVDAIVANPLETMESSGIDATLLWSSGEIAAPGWLTKQAFSHWLVRQLTQRSVTT